MDNPYQREDKTWWFWTETYEECGPYPTKEEAKASLKKYCLEFLGQFKGDD